jgi:hypothetical protein
MAGLRCLPPWGHIIVRSANHCQLIMDAFRRLYLMQASMI